MDTIRCLDWIWLDSVATTANCLAKYGRTAKGVSLSWPVFKTNIMWRRRRRRRQARRWINENARRLSMNESTTATLGSAKKRSQQLRELMKNSSPLRAIMEHELFWGIVLTRVVINYLCYHLMLELECDVMLSEGGKLTSNDLAILKFLVGIS